MLYYKREEKLCLVRAALLKSDIPTSVNIGAPLLPGRHPPRIATVAMRDPEAPSQIRPIYRYTYFNIAAQTILRATDDYTFHRAY
jgi:hypothetical protein